MSRYQNMDHVVLPIVHLNGTSAESLMEMRSNAYDAIRSAYDALKKMAPNGRDYYPEPGRMDKAVDQHRDRLLKLDVLMRELEHEIEEIEQSTRG